VVNKHLHRHKHKLHIKIIKMTNNVIMNTADFPTP